MLKVIDGLRTANHANSVIDFPAQSITTQANSTPSVDMANFAELIYVGICNSVTGSGVGQLQVQESNEAAANFVNITNAILAFTTANTIKIGSVDWRNPSRKQYARLTGTNTTNAITLSGHTQRVQPLNVVSVGNNVVTAVS